MAPDRIVITGARQHNLKNVTVLSVADVLDLTVDEALSWCARWPSVLSHFGGNSFAVSIRRALPLVTQPAPPRAAVCVIDVDQNSKRAASSITRCPRLVMIRPKF